MRKDWMVRLESVSKSFTLHVQGGVSLPVFKDVNFEVLKGESVAITGPSGIGKSTILRMIYGNYAALDGRILVRNGPEIVDMTTASPHTILKVRRETLGYVSQFLRVIPRVSTLEVVMEPLLLRGMSAEEAREHAAVILRRLDIAPRLWDLSPTTFSGGEQQRVNIARVFICSYPILLLDEPTASLDPHNRDTVVTLIREAQHRGAAILGVYHDPLVRRQAADRVVSLEVSSSNSHGTKGENTHGSVYEEAF